MGSSTSMSLVKATQLAASLLASLGLDGEFEYPPQIKLKNNTCYDYIIVGGGTGGSVVASRLAQDQENSVLMLEAGENPPIIALLPGLFYLLQGSYVDYNYSSTYNDYAASSQNYHTKLTAGKMLGGSASLNVHLHLRGSPADFDEWAVISEDDSWRYQNILQYFIKSESLHDKEILDAYPEYHGTEGPTGLTRELHPELDVYFKSFAEMGNPLVKDLNANVTVGNTQSQYTIYKKLRQTPAITYIKNVKDYKNFYYSKNTRVTRIIFNGKVAVAVEAVHKGKTYILKARKEIITSAGTFGSPQLLMLSGIGPQDHLKAMNIDVKCDLPVGDNLIDPAAVLIVFKTKKYLLPLVSPKIVDVLDPLHFPFGLIIGSVALDKCESTDSDYQAYCLLLPHDTPSLTLACANPFGLRDDICDNLQKEVTSRDSLFCYVVNHLPKSRGTVRLNSTDPFGSPEITTGYYTDDKDLNTMVKYIKDFTKLETSSFFKKEGGKLVGLDVQECEGKKRYSSDYWKCYILRRSTSLYHYRGTCAMGAVVDGKLKVKGMDRLRVVDASIMPKGPKSDPNAAVLMLAEKAADMIKMDHN